ncbi:Rhodanese-like domain containing protein [Quillaja saponaria]|uniref:Rhodanese-like domain containing protein n=1 Tax=Quillaja saponaria TaxID=32244 RepID=A0AAD7KRY0_QUISA|nr:Rhodanese-like domain containing protein [Quillaja saponaria]
MAKELIATSFDVSAAGFAVSSSLPSLFYPKNLNQRCLLRKPVNSLKGHTISTERKPSNFCTKAAPRGNLEVTGVPTSVPIRVAHELLQAGHRYLDVRTPEEFNAGHVPGSINIPYMYRVGSGMTKNLKFIAEVLSHFGKDDEIIVGCQSGKRSLMAATDLSAAGFNGITDIAGGYAAWTQNGLPTQL